MEKDEKFEKILNGVFDYLPSASKRNFKMCLKLLAEVSVMNVLISAFKP